MEYAMTLDLTVHSDKEDWLNKLYGKEPTPNDQIQLVKTDIGFIYRSTKHNSKGFGVTDAIINVAMNIGMGVPAGIIANTIYDRIMEKGKNKLIIKEKKLTIITKDELITYIEKTIQEQ